MTRHPAIAEGNAAHACSECGASLRNGESCAARFAELLALDHSRQEPWGSRHGLAFAVFSLQHPGKLARLVLTQCWQLLQRVYVYGDDRADVVQGLRANYRSKHDRNYATSNNTGEAWSVQLLPNREPPRSFAMTIVDLGAFPAETYAAQLDAWCRATLAAWNSVDD